MKIVGLDTATLDQGDMDWGPMRALGELEIHPRSGPDEVVPRAQGAQALLVNEADLAQALKEGVIAGAAVDVLSTEPPPADNPLLTAPNMVVTPHVA